MRIFYVLIFCSLLSITMLWLGRFGKLAKRTAALGAMLSLSLAGVLLLLAVLPRNSFYGKVITHGQELQNDKKLIALTFDDGPYPPYTQKLLEVLASKNVHATFFMVGDNAKKHPEIVRQVQAAGHEIALHAGVHRDLLKANATEVRANIAQGKATLESLTGTQVRYMRPPHGFKDWQVLQVMREAGLTAVNWNVIPRDWTNPGAQRIAERVCSDAQPGSIVLLHDGDSPRNAAPRQQTVDAVGIIIDTLKAEGYEFVTVGEIVMTENNNIRN